MANGIVPDIVECCVAIDRAARDAYDALARAENRGELAAFWARMRDQEEEHLLFWDRLQSNPDLARLAQPFEDPLQVLGELRAAGETAADLARRCQGGVEVFQSFLAAYELEFLLAHPAFEVLFRLAEEELGIPSPEEDYRAHIDEFVAAFDRFCSPDPAMALAAKLLRRLWAESRALANNLRTFRALSGVVPICMHCKAIRDKDGRWDPLEAHLNPRTGVHLSHGVCPACIESHYPEFAATKR